jgi:hypothetical protein
MPRRAAHASPPPLLVWSELQAIGEVERERQALREQIAGMRPRSQRRDALASRLADLTRRQLSLEAKLRRGQC